MAIKSYMGKRAKPTKGSSENIKVSDYMSTNLTTFKPEQSVLEVMNTLIKKKISGGRVSFFFCLFATTILPSHTKPVLPVLKVHSSSSSSIGRIAEATSSLDTRTSILGFFLEPVTTAIICDWYLTPSARLIFPLVTNP